MKKEKGNTKGLKSGHKYRNQKKKDEKKKKQRKKEKKRKIEKKGRYQNDHNTILVLNASNYIETCAVAHAFEN